ncbi:cutinase family protein [Nocardia sp. NPDC052566]|uniref:cutinase family protein n=1 Tax=Nocardia sp. NPDC052566 TaxID=3364330 RepID=UPI0037C671C5
MLLLAAGIGTATGLGTTAWANPCTDIDFVVARGTGEPGWLGAQVGDPLYGALLETLPVSASAYGVNYPADLTNASSVSDGTRDMTNHLVRQHAMCPDQRFILAGYSQGAAVTHGVLGTGVVTQLSGIYVIPPEVGAQVAAVLLFGDPIKLLGWGVPGEYGWRTANYCAGGDPVCGGGIDPTAHTNYGAFVWNAAWFAASRV